LTVNHQELKSYDQVLNLLVFEGPATFRFVALRSDALFNQEFVTVLAEIVVE
jgi:hypothetical protein